MDIFFVIADPTRRKMLEMMRAGELPAGAFVAEFRSISQPAISQHLKVLRDSGLVSVRADRQKRFYSIKLDELRAVGNWVESFHPGPPAKAQPPELVLSEGQAAKAKPKPRPAKQKIDEAPLTLDLFG